MELRVLSDKPPRQINLPPDGWSEGASPSDNWKKKCRVVKEGEGQWTAYFIEYATGNGPSLFYKGGGRWSADRPQLQHYADAALAHKAVASLTKMPEEEPTPPDSVPEGFAANVIRLVRDRGSSYGPPSTNHQLTADILSLWLSRRLDLAIKLSAEDACMLNVLQKASRLAFATKDDSWADIAGYCENVAMLKAGTEEQQQATGEQ